MQTLSDHCCELHWPTRQVAEEGAFFLAALLCGWAWVKIRQREAQSDSESFVEMLSCAREQLPRG